MRDYISKINPEEYSIEPDKIKQFIEKVDSPNTLFALVEDYNVLRELVHILDSLEDEFESPVIYIEFDESNLDWDGVIIPIAHALIRYIEECKIDSEELNNYSKYLEYVIENSGGLRSSHVEQTLELIDKIPKYTKKSLFIVFTNFEHILNMKTSLYRPDGVLRGIFQLFGDSVSLNLIINSEDAFFKIFHDREAPFYRGGALINFVE
jgi:hypothetical protein